MITEIHQHFSATFALIKQLMVLVPTEKFRIRLYIVTISAHLSDVASMERVLVVSSWTSRHFHVRVAPSVKHQEGRPLSVHCPMLCATTAIVSHT